MTTENKYVNRRLILTHKMYIKQNLYVDRYEQL